MADKRFCLVNKDTGEIENTIIWDGEAKWSPPPGFDVVLEADALKQGVPYAPALLPQAPDWPDEPDS